MGQEKIFHKLEGIHVPEELDGFHLDTLVLEKEMKQYNGGINLATLKSNHFLGDEDLDRKFVSYFNAKLGISFGGEKDLEKLMGKGYEIPAPCSMLVESVDSLFDYMSQVYQIAHFHYILGKRYNLLGKFPDGCCGFSSRNNMLSHVKHGFLNSAFVGSFLGNHGYVVLPFVMKNEKDVCGSIVVDPTSDQSDFNQERNSVFIKLGSKWKYITPWENRENLFPDIICSLDVLENLNGFYDPYLFHDGGQKFLEKAFSNPLELK